MIMEVMFMWLADLGNGNYRNPILYADYSDPDVIRVGEDYSKEYKKYTDNVRKEQQTMDFDREYTPESEISWELQEKIEKELKEAEDKLRIEKEMFQGLWSRL